MKKHKPTQCQVGSLTYKIDYVKPGKGKLLEEGDMGSVSQTHKLIEIDKSLSDQMTLIVLIHEILHAIGDCLHPNRSPFCKETVTSPTADLLVQALQSANIISS